MSVEKEMQGQNILKGESYTVAGGTPYLKERLKELMQECPLALRDGDGHPPKREALGAAVKVNSLYGWIASYLLLAMGEWTAQGSQKGDWGQSDWAVLPRSLARAWTAGLAPA